MAIKCLKKGHGLTPTPQSAKVSSHDRLYLLTVSMIGLLEVGVDGCPLADGGDDAEAYHFVAEFAEVVIALVKFFMLFWRTSNRLYFYAVFINGGLHGHHDMIVGAVVDISAYGPCEWFSAHCSSDHFDRKVGRALE